MKHSCCKQSQLKSNKVVSSQEGAEFAAIEQRHLQQNLQEEEKDEDKEEEEEARIGAASSLQVFEDIVQEVADALGVSQGVSCEVNAAAQRNGEQFH